MSKKGRMTWSEMQEYAEKNKKKALEMLSAAPEATHEEMGVKPGKVAVRGFAAFKKHINRNGRPKVKDPKVSVSIRIPLSAAASLRATGPGWQTRMSDYLMKGISKGELG